MQNAATSISKLGALARVIRRLSAQAATRIEQQFDFVLEQLVAATAAPWAFMHLADDQHQVLVMVARVGMDGAWQRMWARIPFSAALPPAIAYTAARALELKGDEAPPGLEVVECAPVMGAEVAIGVVGLVWPEGREVLRDPQRLELLVAMGELVGMAIEQAALVAELNRHLEQLSELNRRLEELSITDGLTGVYNRRYMEVRLEEEVHRARRLGHPLSLIMADIDHFKRLNDRLGHQAGDEALKLFARWLKEGVRRVDVVGRYGGEEFVAVLVNCTQDDALKVAEKLRARVERSSRQGVFEAIGGFTVSMGVAELRPGQDAKALVAAADRALYQAKAAGRNRVLAAT